jgi:hypothetical protein
MAKEEARVGVIVAAVFVALCLLALLVYLAFWRVSDYFIVIYSQFSILMTISSPFPDSFKKNRFMAVEKNYILQILLA